MIDLGVAIYRHYAADGELLYVGASLKPIQRLETHKAMSPWFYEIATVTIEWLEVGVDAHAAERKAIHDEAPKYNKAYQKKGTPLDPSVDEIVLTAAHTKT